MASVIKLFCILDGDSSPFSIKIEVNDTVDDLKDAIKEKNPNVFSSTDARELILFHVSIPSAPKILITLSNLTVEERKKKHEELEDPTSEISEVFGTTPAKKTIHVIVQRPAPVGGKYANQENTFLTACNAFNSFFFSFPLVANIISPAQTALSPSPPII
jgi:hypothetical protein